MTVRQLEEPGTTQTPNGPGSELEHLLATAARSETPAPATCLALAKVHLRAGQPARALRWACTTSDASESLADWMAATGVLRRCLPQVSPLPRTARIAVLGSYTTQQFAALLPLAAARTGVAAEVYECGYGQFRQEVLDPSSGLYEFRPDVVVFAVHAGSLDLPQQSADPAGDVEREVGRWTSLWRLVQERTGARVVQHSFVAPPEAALGHLALRTLGSYPVMLQRLNLRLGEEAGGGVALVDCERLAALAGKRTWFDARYWFRSKQAVSLACVPLLARHTAAVVAAQLGQSRKCLVLDLDNTLWGGVLGEDGIGGIALGSGPVGEAYSAFQRFVLALKERGIVLAICSKNNSADVREVFERHPDMLLRLDDVAVLSAGWDDKPAQLRRIATTLGLGLDALVFADDNPAEREVVRQLVPEVDVLPLPADPAGYVQALADYLLFEPAALTAEDVERTRMYQARARTAELQETASSLDDFLRSLDMVATPAGLDEVTLPRVTQLIGKTNQFNLTGRRRTQAEVAALAEDSRYRVLSIRLRDRFADHGLVGVLIGRAMEDGTFDIDTWLLSCRVIGRTLEHEMLALAADAARGAGCAALCGMYVPSTKNALVADLYPRLGFTPESPGPDAAPGSTCWRLGLDEPVTTPDLIRIEPARP